MRGALDLMVQYPIWIVTEHVPTGDFVPNRDIVAGEATRMRVKSGVDLDALATTH